MAFEKGLWSGEASRHESLARWQEIDEKLDNARIAANVAAIPQICSRNSRESSDVARRSSAPAPSRQRLACVSAMIAFMRTSACTDPKRALQRIDIRLRAHA